MKSVVLRVVLFLLVGGSIFAEEAKWPLVKDKVIFAATVNDTLIKVYISTGAFDKANHKVIRGLEAEQGRPSVDGRTVVGIDGLDVPSASERKPHLTRLAVAFGDKIVEAPADLISQVFMPNVNLTFDDSYDNGSVALSSDGKAVDVTLLAGEIDRVEFFFTSEGKTYYSIKRW